MVSLLFFPIRQNQNLHPDLVIMNEIGRLLRFPDHEEGMKKAEGLGLRAQGKGIVYSIALRHAPWSQRLIYTSQACRVPQGRRRGAIEGYLPKGDNASDDIFLVIREWKRG